MTETEGRKKLFCPPSRTPHDNLGETQRCCTPRKGASTGQVWPRCGPGKCPKKGVEIWGSPKKTPPFLGGSRKKRYHRVAGAEPHHLRRSRRNRPPGASAARTRKNRLTRRQLSAICSSHFVKAESLKNSFTLGVGGVGRTRPVRGDAPFRNRKISPRSNKQGRGKVCVRKPRIIFFTFRRTVFPKQCRRLPPVVF
jgi:hypothetical protein